MKTKIIAVLLLSAVLLCACTGCCREKYRNEKYTIYSEGGKCYLKFSDTFATRGLRANANGCVIYPGPSAGTLPELQKKLLSGDFEVTSLYSLIRCDTDGDNTLEILDPDECQIPILPKDLQIDSVGWSGCAYGFSLTDKADGERRGSTLWVDENTFRSRFGECFTALSPETHTVLDDTVVSDRNARVIHLTTSAAEQRHVCYTLPGANGYTLYIREVYTLRAFSNPNIRTSDSVPQFFHIFGANGEYFFYGSFSEPEERPSVEWLSSFGLTPFGAAS